MLIDGENTGMERETTMEIAVETQFLIVGAGPAGASLACFLASHGLQGLVISASPGTANTPRAHLTNSAAIECLRDIGLEEQAMKLGHTGDDLKYVRWCHSVTGDEYGRVYAFGNGPDMTEQYQLASPCKHIDLPQTLLEPILVRYATNNGFAVRFQTTLLSLADEETETGGKKILATVKDRLTNSEYKIRTKYLFGADGARSTVVQQLSIPLRSGPTGGEGPPMINVMVRADLNHVMEHRKGDLHLVLQPDLDAQSPDFAAMSMVRMVKPWTEWMFNLMPKPTFDPRAPHVTKDYYLPTIKSLIGPVDTPTEVLHVAYWKINETVAEYYSTEARNVFILGDAAHRHPPGAGLGSNTCIQDAYNLAWKVAYVEKGLAGPSLLDTYSVERQPVGQDVVTRANDAFRNQHPLYEVLGMFPPGRGDPDAVAHLSSSTPSGAERRRRLRNAIRNTRGEFNGIGTEMGQFYNGSSGIYLADETEPFALTGKAAENPILYHHASTYPGRRLPHVWLNTASPGRPVSTIDLAGHGAFALFTGHGGEAWKEAASTVGKELGVEIRAYSIGFRLDWEDVYFDWADVSGVEESGVVLVRPDRFVAWRAKSVPEGLAVVCKEKLGKVMRAVLGL